MVMSDFAVDKALLRVELKSVSTTSGAQFVMIFGQTMMAVLFADSLDSLQLVHTRTHIMHICCTFYELASHCKLHRLQVQSFTSLPSLVGELALSGLTMCTALVLKVD